MLSFKHLRGRRQSLIPSIAKNAFIQTFARQASKFDSPDREKCLHSNIRASGVKVGFPRSRKTPSGTASGHHRDTRIRRGRRRKQRTAGTIRDNHPGARPAPGGGDHFGNRLPLLQMELAQLRLARTHDANRNRNRFLDWGHFVHTPQPPICIHT